MNTRKRLSLAGAALWLALCLAFSLTACGGSGSSAPADDGAAADSSGEPILIGTISPNTGNLAAYGTAVTTGCTSAIAAAYAKQAGYDKVGMV